MRDGGVQRTGAKTRPEPDLSGCSVEDVTAALLHRPRIGSDGGGLAETA